MSDSSIRKTSFLSANVGPCRMPLDGFSCHDFSVPSTWRLHEAALFGQCFSNFWIAEETLERFLPGRPSTSASNAGGALKEYREVSGGTGAGAVHV